MQAYLHPNNNNNNKTTNTFEIACVSFFIAFLFQRINLNLFSKC